MPPGEKPSASAGPAGGTTPASGLRQSKRGAFVDDHVGPDYPRIRRARLQWRLHRSHGEARLPALKALLDELAAGASEREANRVAPHEQIRRIADAGPRSPARPGRRRGRGVLGSATCSGSSSGSARPTRTSFTSSVSTTGSLRRSCSGRSRILAARVTWRSSTRGTSSATPSPSRASARSASTSIRSSRPIRPARGTGSMARSTIQREACIRRTRPSLRRHRRGTSPPRSSLSIAKG